MKLNGYISVAAVALMALVSCGKDSPASVVDDVSKEVVLDGNDGDIVLNHGKMHSLALTLHWTENGDGLRDRYGLHPGGDLQ